MIKVFAITFLLPWLTSCGDATFGTLKVAGTKTLVLPVDKGERVTAEKCNSIIFGIPTGHAGMIEGIEMALEKGQGDLLQDVVIKESDVGFLLIYDLHCMVVEGTILRLTQRN